MRHESWEPDPIPEGPSHDSFFADNDQVRRFGVEDGLVCTWTGEADEDNTAMSLFYDHRGWGRCEPVEE
jgi:hypothetical protein